VVSIPDFKGSTLGLLLFYCHEEAVKLLRGSGENPLTEDKTVKGLLMEVNNLTLKKKNCYRLLKKQAWRGVSSPRSMCLGWNLVTDPIGTSERGSAIPNNR
jgi:hypothetical protein